MNALLQFFNQHRQKIWATSIILISTFFLAKAINTVAAYYFFPLELKRPVAASTRRPLTIQNSVDIRSIISRNIFNSKAQLPTPMNIVKPSSEIVASSLPLELLGTIVFRRSKYSTGLIRSRKDNKTAYYGPGDKILNATVVKVERFNVILENRGRLERLEVQAAKSKLPAARPSRRKTPSASNPSSGESKDVDFEEIGPGRFAVPQSYVDNVLKNFSSILTQARMVPNIVEGNKTDGFKVFQIKKNSIFEKLGMKNQDILKQVNGAKLDSFEKATGLFTALRNEKTISIDIVRGGSRLNYTYEIR